MKTIVTYSLSSLSIRRRNIKLEPDFYMSLYILQQVYISEINKQEKFSGAIIKNVKKLL